MLKASRKTRSLNRSTRELNASGYCRACNNLAISSSMRGPAVGCVPSCLGRTCHALYTTSENRRFQELNTTPPVGTRSTASDSGSCLPMCHSEESGTEWNPSLPTPPVGTRSTASDSGSCLPMCHSEKSGTEWNPSLPTLASLREQLRHGGGFDQLTRLIEMVVDDRARLNAERVINGRQQLHGVDRLFQRARSRFVRFAVHITALHARAGDDRRVAIRPMIPPIGTVAVS